MRRLKWIYTREEGFAALVIFWVCIIMVMGIFVPVDHRVVNNLFFDEHVRADMPDDSLWLSKGQGILKVGEEYVLSSTFGDQYQYLLMANGEASIPPYKFRMLAPAVVRGMIFLEDQTLGRFLGSYQRMDKFRKGHINFWILNFFSILIATFIFFKILRMVTERKLLLFGGVVLFVTQYSILKSATYAMVDPFCFMLFNFAIYYLMQKKWVHLAVFLLLLGLAKDAFIIFTPALFIHFLMNKQLNWKTLGLVAIPLIAFLGLRLIMKESATNIQYDWDISQGRFSFGYLTIRFSSLGHFIPYIAALAFAYGVTWFYIPKMRLLRQHQLFYFTLTFTLLLLIAQLLLASRIVVALAPVMPLLILIPVTLFEGREAKV